MEGPDFVRKEETITGAQKGRKAKYSLGLTNNDPLPRCGHFSKVRATRLADAGDPSHLEEGHLCADCMCLQTAGKGTDHLGTGWCMTHEKYHTHSSCATRAKIQTAAIREGYPDRVWALKSPDNFLEKVENEGDMAQELISMRESQVTLLEFVGEIVSQLKTGKRGDGSQFTERAGKDGDLVSASDIELLKAMTSLMKANATMANIELKIADSDFVSMDSCKVFFAEIMRIVKMNVEPDILKSILKGLKTVKQPDTGRRSKK